jgi:hypothetical protein
MLTSRRRTSSNRNYHGSCRGLWNWAANGPCVHPPRYTSDYEAPVEWQQTIEELGKKICRSATSSTSNATWPDVGANPALRSQKPATRRLNPYTASDSYRRNLYRLMLRFQRRGRSSFCRKRAMASLPRLICCAFSQIANAIDSSQRGYVKGRATQLSLVFHPTLSLPDTPTAETRRCWQNSPSFTVSFYEVSLSQFLHSYRN